MKLTEVQIAVVCHEANRTLCEVQGEAGQTGWDEAEEWQQDSAIKGVEYALAHPDTTPEKQHQAWTDHKLSEGWVAGSVKNATTKEHPCLVPYQELPETQKRKDHLFLAVVRALSS